MNSVDQARKALIIAVAAFVVMPTLYELLKILMPLIFMLIGLLVMVKLIAGKFSRW